ncbi:hypothetical protein AB0D49_08425 [Streptomyces sp. NPDC048290]|uniref:hypothetical protein n=1 Tax=Streptomyces sp. NPDC048290 TaxID=3155811 RepID=UPI00341EA59A
MTAPLTEQQLAAAETALATYQQHPPTGFACCSAHAVADHAPALLAEVRRLHAELADATEQRDHARDDVLPESGTRQCGHDDYHDGHPWHDNPDLWCPGHGYDEEDA